MASTGDIRALRHLAGLATAVAALLMTTRMYGPDQYIDHEIATKAGNLLLSGGFDVFAVMPEAQMGPLSLTLAGLLPMPIYTVLVCATGYLFIQLCYAATNAAPRFWHIIAAILLGGVWYRFAPTSHADDVLVLLGAVAIAAARQRGTPWWAAVGFVVGIAAKPTALILLPLVWLVSRRAALAGVVGAAVVWAPFVFADLSGFLVAGGGIANVFPYSLPGFLGVEVWSDYPWWVRPAQLVVCFALAWVLGRRVGFPAAILAVFAAKTMLEPGTFPLYWQSIVAASFLVDIAARWRYPMLTTISLIGWLFGLRGAPTAEEGLLRLGLLLALLIAVWLSRSPNPSPSSAECAIPMTRAAA